MTVQAAGVVPDIFSEDVGRDPFAAYAELRTLRGYSSIPVALA